MFRLQNNVPEVYVNESRDFQLLCRLYDSAFGSVKYTIDSIRHTSNANECNGRLVELLKSKVGFFSTLSLTQDELRYVLLAFPSIIRNKGTLEAIKQTIHMWFRLNHIDARLIQLKEDAENRQLIIMTNIVPKDTTLLTEIFKYICPAGYEIVYDFATEAVVRGDMILKDTATITVTHDPAHYSNINNGNESTDYVGYLNIAQIADPAIATNNEETE